MRRITPQHFTDMEKRKYRINRIWFIGEDGERKSKKVSVVVHDIETHRKKLQKEGCAKVRFSYEEM